MRKKAKPKKTMGAHTSANQPGKGSNTFAQSPRTTPSRDPYQKAVR